MENLSAADPCREALLMPGGCAYQGTFPEPLTESVNTIKTPLTKIEKTPS